MKKVFLPVEESEGNEIIKLLEESGIEYCTSLMRLGDQGTLHRGVVFADDNEKKVVDILHKSGRSYASPVPYNRAW